MKKSVPLALVGILFLVASFNVYEFFQEKKRVRLEQEAKIEEARLQRLEENRQAEVAHQIKLNELALAKEQSKVELLEKKITAQKRLEQYEVLKNAQKIAKQDRRLQLRIEQARKLQNPEGLPRKMVQEIQQATYLTIRNNPKDYIGTYQPQGILKADRLTKGGADGLMMFSMVSTDLKAIEEMIAIGHEINTRNKSGHTPLMFAGAYNTPEVVNYLVRSGADIKATDYLTEGSVLHLASRFNPKPEVVEALVKSGLDLEAKDKDGNTPLLVAVKYNQNLQVVEKLIELGVDTEVTDKKGTHAFSYLNDRLREHRPKYKISKISKGYESDILHLLKP